VEESMLDDVKAVAVLCFNHQNPYQQWEEAQKMELSKPKCWSKQRKVLDAQTFFPVLNGSMVAVA